MAVFKPTEISQKIQQLAEQLTEERPGEYPGKAQMRWLLRSLLPSTLEEGEQLDIPTGIRFLPPVAISLPYATKQILKIPKSGLSPSQVKEVEDTLKILQATPKRALQTVSDIVVEKPETFKDAAALLGSWGVKGRRITVSPVVKSEKLPPTYKQFLQQIESKGHKYNLPEAFAHELGHEISERLLQKRGKSLFGKVARYQSDVGLWEGIAEYLGKSLSKKAKVPFIPKFPYGSEQELIFNVLETYPSKNPYLNVYRFLQKSQIFK